MIPKGVDKLLYVRKTITLLRSKFPRIGTTESITLEPKEQEQVFQCLDELEAFYVALRHKG